MDYNSLTAQILTWSNRNDPAFINAIPNFIDQAINQIYIESKSIGFQITVGGNLVMNTSTLNKPANWYKTISFSIIDNRLANPISTNLLLRSYEFCTSYWPKFANTSTPKFYADIGYGQFFIAPTPDYAYPIEIVYSALPLFNAFNPTNFLTERYPDLLLSACMLQTAPYLKNSESLKEWQSLYDRSLKGINNDFDKSFNDRTSKRDVS